VMDARGEDVHGSTSGLSEGTVSRGRGVERGRALGSLVFY
jgi:hypothetical protein